MNFDQKTAISELGLFSLLDFVLSGFSYSHLVKFDVGKKYRDNSLGYIKGETSKSLLFFAFVLEELNSRKHHEYLRSLATNKKNSRDLHQSLRLLGLRQEIILRLFWISVAEELPKVALVKSARVVQGWEVVTSERVPHFEEEDITHLSSNFFSCFRDVICCKRFIGGHEMTFDSIGQREEVVGYVPSSAIRVHSLFELINNEVSRIVEGTELPLDVPEDTDPVEEMELLLGQYSNVQIPSADFLREIFGFTERVFWTLINDEVPRFRVDDLAVRAGLKIVHRKR